MLAVVDPVALVGVALNIREDTSTVCLVSGPVAFIHVACWVDQATIALSQALVPHAFIDGAIRILDGTQAVSDCLTPVQPRNNNKLAFVEIARAIDISEVVQDVSCQSCWSCCLVPLLLPRGRILDTL